MNRLIALFLVLALPLAAPAKTRHQTDEGPVTVAPMVTGLTEPWAIAFLPGDEMLITERDGRLLHFGGDGPQTVRGVPKVAAVGQGGLLDVVAARDFADSREIFLTYAQPHRGGARTALAVARLSADARTLEDLRVIFAMSEASGAGRHFGSRVVEAEDGTLFLTIGDRGAADRAQDPEVHNGKVVRVNRDGSIPADNPSPGSAVWAKGVRDGIGLAAHPEVDTLYSTDRGPGGGYDEVNAVRAARSASAPRNRGWSSRYTTGIRRSRPRA